MSLANLIVQPTRAVLQADAGGFLRSGVLAELGPKLHPFEAARAVLSWRGSVDSETLRNVMYVSTKLGPRTKLPELLKALPSALQEATAITLATFDTPDAAACIYLACYDPTRRRPIGMILTNDAAWFDGEVQPYRWIVVDNAVGVGTATLAELMGRPIEMADLSDSARFDIERDSLALIEAQRARPWGAWPTPDAGAPVAVRIGGWVDQAEVTAGGIAIKRLVYWGDRLGERIAA